MTCPLCLFNCTVTLDVSAYQGVCVGRKLGEKDEGVQVTQQARVNASSDLMSTILHSLADDAFWCVL